ncbi:hypothetical protein C1H46_030026 [Malus baccata]|uniref:Uncharacterized protein n=1 Tax=Malus baccata TaxID=106549 RepID=A0A540LD70_MALBA|nr:hypothetical protein C1H46_030026 [Malus baccata]
MGSSDLSTFSPFSLSVVLPCSFCFSFSFGRWQTKGIIIGLLIETYLLPGFPLIAYGLTLKMQKWRSKVMTAFKILPYLLKCSFKASLGVSHANPPTKTLVSVNTSYSSQPSFSSVTLDQPGSPNWKMTIIEATVVFFLSVNNELGEQLQLRDRPRKLVAFEIQSPEPGKIARTHLSGAKQATSSSSHESHSTSESTASQSID